VQVYLRVGTAERVVAPRINVVQGERPQLLLLSDHKNTNYNCKDNGMLKGCVLLPSMNEKLIVLPTLGFEPFARTCGVSKTSYTQPALACGPRRQEVEAGHWLASRTHSFSFLDFRRTLAHSENSILWAKLEKTKLGYYLRAVCKLLRATANCVSQFSHSPFLACC
jgi:hypothetical protein